MAHIYVTINKRYEMQIDPEYDLGIENFDINDYEHIALAEEFTWAHAYATFDIDIEEA